MQIFVMLLALLAGFGTQSAMAQSPDNETAIFAGGCFWCVESDMQKVPGVISVVSGYTGGTTENPTYEEVSHKATGHVEAALVTYDPAKVSYGQLLEIYWRNIDPFDAAGQFCDHGPSYMAVIFISNEAQKRAAEESFKEMEARFTGQKITVTTRAAQTFYPAEDYHQDYAQKNPGRYQFYRYRCGRDERLKEIWGKEAGGH